MYYAINTSSAYELYHHGVRGQKWGVRHYQNEDGSYKPGAEGRYSDSDGRLNRSGKKRYGLENLSKGKNKDKTRSLEQLKNERKKLNQDIKNKAKIYGDNKSKEGKETIKAAKNTVDDYLKSKYGEQTFDNLKKEQAKKIAKAAAITAVSLAAIGGTIALARSDTGKDLIDTARATLNYKKDEHRFNKTNSQSSFWQFQYTDKEGNRRADSIQNIRSGNSSNNKTNTTRDIINNYYKKSGSEYGNYAIYAPKNQSEVSKIINKIGREIKYYDYGDATNKVLDAIFKPKKN